MHVRELVEMGALVAAHGPALIFSAEPLSPRALEEYWTASKCRFDRWNRQLKKCSTDLSDQPELRRETVWQLARPTLVEILATELLTRCWTAVACAAGERRQANDVGLLARSVLIGHLEARNRALNLMVYGRGFDIEQLVRLNQLRRRSERWTDLLLGHVMCAADVSEFAFDAQRTREFSEDFRSSIHYRTDGTAWQLLLASLRAAFSRGVDSDSPNADLNERIAGSILGCFGAEMFDSTGLLKSMWLLRLSTATTDTQGMIDLLLATENSPATSDSTEHERSFRQDQLGDRGQWMHWN